MRSAISLGAAAPSFASQLGRASENVNQRWRITPGPVRSARTWVAPGFTQTLSRLDGSTAAVDDARRDRASRTTSRPSSGFACADASRPVEPQAARTPSTTPERIRPAVFIASHDQVDLPAGHVDESLDGLAGEGAHDARMGEDKALDRLLIRVARHVQPFLQLAVEGDRQRDRRVHERRRIEVRPGLVGERVRVPEPRPELLAEV